MHQARFSRGVIAVPMAALAVATLYPLFFTANVSLKSRREYVLDQFGLAEAFQTSNFVDAWTTTGLSTYMFNSIVITGGAVAALLLLGSMAGFAFSHVQFRGSRTLFLVCLAALLIPFQVIMVPFTDVMAQLGLLDTRTGLILAYTAQFLPFTVFLMASYYSRIPLDIIEAARVDGSSTLGIYRRIMLPLGRPALLSVGILNALFCWNDVLIALLVMRSSSNRTLMIGVTALRGQYSDNIPLFAAGVFLSALPMLLVYLFFQRQITEGVTAGATKG
ncbi:carbohydrate ABC transporter permease [Nitriliruptor alkaliphilus]|uniref:carbohydrate ABC transporter permease n=1 Tax=Nitriliruptor alkaliphilus TaxID=427918 RepID=UPI0006967F05|nr:carbohydrate ABC transporter permease [Nitriliruptor alkaliphilus]